MMTDVGMTKITQQPCFLCFLHCYRDLSLLIKKDGLRPIKYANVPLD
jgi:hypothetical protein